MRKVFIIMVLLTVISPAQAQNFYDFSAVSSSGDTLYCYIDNGTAMVTCPGDINSIGNHTTRKIAVVR